MREGLQKVVSLDETIVAIATPIGKSAIGVVRVSGTDAQAIVDRHFNTTKPLEHRQASVGFWKNEHGEVLDEVVVTVFRAPHSYTGDDLVEISAHGNPFVLQRLVQSICSGKARLAGPGEFTLRAVANGKMDLTQAEAIRDFVEAQTQQQARTALRQIAGGAARRLGPSKADLVDVIALLEAGIDFAEDDVDVPAGESIASKLRAINKTLAVVRDTFEYGRMLTAGARLAILGKPNVGKSSLFNRLVASERAIVTEIPGTTRDVLAETIDLDGIPLRLADTAGIRQTQDHIESIGITRSLEALSEADITLVVLDGSQPLDPEDENVLLQSVAVPRLVVINKSDLPCLLDYRSDASKTIHVSAFTGSGLSDLRNAIRAFLVDRQLDLVDDFVLTNARQHEAIGRAVEALDEAAAALSNNVPHEMVLLNLYMALTALNDLTGEVATEDILDRIFSTFCIGK